MKLLRYSGGKLQNPEDGIGSGPFGLPLDPFLDAGQPLGRLMDVVELGYVGNGVKQRVETLVPSGGRRTNPLARAASPHPNDGARFTDLLSHPIAFPCDAPAPIAETGTSALIQQHRVIGWDPRGNSPSRPKVNGL
jgi:hypothetical protein